MFRLRKTTSEKENAFWNWFVKKSDEFFVFEKNQEQLFDQLSRALGRVHPDICFEFGPVENGKRDFVLSAGGIRQIFPAVTSLYRAAPELPQWNLIAFRPRRDIALAIEFNERRLGPEDIWFKAQAHDKKVGLILYTNFPNDEQQTIMQMLYLLLDNALGEYDVETKIGFIEHKLLPEAPEQEGLLPFKQLPNQVDDLFQRFN